MLRSSFISRTQSNFWTRACLLLLFALSSTANQAATTPLQPTEEHAQTAREITRQLMDEHYERLTLTSSLQQQVFERYLSALDNNKAFFLAKDVDEFSSQLPQISAAIRGGELELPFKMYQRLQTRMTQRLEQVLKHLAQPHKYYRFDQDEFLQLDREQAPWATSSKALDTYWRQRVTHSLIGLKLAGKSLEEAAELLSKRFRNQLNRIHQTNSEDVFQSFINAYTGVLDPHTQYLSPQRSESFNIQMKLSLDGIGAILKSEDEYTKIVSLVPGGPAEKSGLLKPTDKIIGVGQGVDGEIVNVIGWRLDEVVELIRGPRDTLVRLEILPAKSLDTSVSKIINIRRNTVKLEDQAAQKSMLEIMRDGQTYHVGIIEIPAFYVDFEAWRQGKSDYRSTTRDVLNLIRELQQEGMDALVIDLRNNGGGALQEANSLIGLFINRGPTVQVRDAQGRVSVMGDPDPQVAYEGPLAVLVNRLAASASEIFAGAIQDYGRGLVLGNRTYGKGTVQVLNDLQHGQLKLTRAKFYRISGDSTQKHGVEPDLSFPNLFDENEIGESALKQALEWDQIPKVRHAFYQDYRPLLTELRQRHQKRSQEDANFRYLVQQVAFMQAQRQQTQVSLNETVRRLQREERQQHLLDIENQRRVSLGLDALTQLEHQEEEDALLAEDAQQESAEILVDMILLSTRQ
ncbi:carboxyl-terminal processing protease [Allopseudospirillum japonicum]|uniref:Carboxyl-terminal processing protease n=1 Tax=Allopseudospirillum japonicum TaxID=64971 RepID=A0A1H6RU24_9GAMM|nr:carboxy terminal-processing peptidase [Allopseudospirillum japonicum]SEI59239.1 carboxyl-terminal processing protease [Allopseudospirillum japonicum]